MDTSRAAMKGQTRFRADCCCCCGHGVSIELLKRYAKEIPKVELHVHVEGTIRNRLARELIRENGLVQRPVFEDSSCSSSEDNSWHTCTTSSTERSSSSSEGESQERTLPEARSATEATIADIQPNAFAHEGERMLLVQNTAGEGSPVSSAIPSSRLITGKNPQQQVSLLDDGAKPTCTMSNAPELQEPRRPVERRQRRAERNKERGGRREKKKPPESGFSRTYTTGPGGRNASQKGYITECHEDLWRRDPELSAEARTATKVTPYLRNRRMHIYPSLDAFILDYADRAYILRKAEDYYKILLVYLESAAADNVRHVEFHFARDPTTGIPCREQLRELHRACCEAERRWGITTRKILGFLRFMSAEEHVELLNEAGDDLRLIDAVGLVSSEKGNENRKFKYAFDVAKSKGLHCVAHAGEEGPASNIRDAIMYNHAERIDHGLAAVEDEEVLQSLIHSRTPLTVCPLSNVCLGACRAVEEHPLLKCRPQCGLMLRLNEEEEAEKDEDTKAKMEKREGNADGVEKSQQSEDNREKNGAKEAKEEEQEAKKTKQATAGAFTFHPCITTGSRVSRQYPGLIDQGLKVTINSDDPAFFGGGVYNNFRAVIETNRWGEQQRQSAAPGKEEELKETEGKRKAEHATRAGGGEGAATTAEGVRGRAEGAAAGEGAPAAAGGAATTGDAAAVGEDDGINAECASGKAADVPQKKGACAPCRDVDATRASPPLAVCAAGQHCPCGSVGCGRADSCETKAAAYEPGMRQTEADNISCRSAFTASTPATPAGENSSSSSCGGSDAAGPPLLQESLHWRLDTVKQVVINGVEGSFLTTAEKQRLLNEIEAFDRRFRRRHSIGPCPSRKTGRQAAAATPVVQKTGGAADTPAFCQTQKAPQQD